VCTIKIIPTAPPPKSQTNTQITTAERKKKSNTVKELMNATNKKDEKGKKALQQYFHGFLSTTNSI
jgi:hypothetical protein